MAVPPLLRLLERIAVAFALVAGASIAVLAALIAVDILGRDVFGVSVQGTDEIGGYVLAFVGSLGMALTLLRRGHPRIDLFFRFFPPILRDALHALAQATVAAFALFMTWHAWGELQTTLRFGAITNTPLQTPLWVPQGVWVAGMAFFALTACVAACHAVVLLKAGGGAVSRVYGAPTVEEEVEGYVAADARSTGASEAVRAGNGDARD
ncbi:TRAP transporter small permease [Jannaschia sp. LMIT008]|uniref:TRAP transporter small permease subunit n=1 Tax=Jannaschia maritima TaxID=3032585 RepID=UPI0028120B5C|nr:TRAP transporter small permease [Jannaschia sp. LMIT008]